jgi:uncharacterized metal-binding protein
MPNGRTHAKWTLYLTLPSFIIGAAIDHSFLGGLACSLGCLAGIPLTPDLDQEGISTSEYWIIKWTCGLGFLWTMLWFPYALACPHRSFVSHFPIVSTLIRLLYLGFFIAVACYFGMPFPELNLYLAAYAVLGLIISDVAHWALDVKFGDGYQRK